MSILFAFLCAGISGLSTFLAIKKWPQKSKTKHLPLLCLIGSCVIGAACGWMIPVRVEFWTNYIRILLVVAVLAGTVYTDLDDHRIPNLYPLVLAGGFCAVTVLDFLSMPEAAGSVFIGGIVGGVVIFLILRLFRFLSRGGIGYGDIKLLSAMGAVLGIYGTVSTLFLAQLIALVVALGLLIAKKATMKDSLPFAPFFYLGFLATLFLGTF